MKKLVNRITGREADGLRKALQEERRKRQSTNESQELIALMLLLNHRMLLRLLKLKGNSDFQMEVHHCRREFEKVFGMKLGMPRDLE